MAGIIHSLNDRVARSSFGRYFLLEGCGHPKERKGARFMTELRGGLTTSRQWFILDPLTSKQF
jgi:AGZA family xanthine/uracil permease-like MFS transporter